MTSLLILILLPSAIAEKGYESIKEAVTQVLDDGFTLTADVLTEEDYPDDQVITMLFYPWKNQVILWGKNADNKMEGTLWESELCVLLFGGYCGSWEQLEASLEEEYSLNFILQVEEDGELLLIDDAEKAAIMYQAILETIE